MAAVIEMAGAPAKHTAKRKAARSDDGKQRRPNRTPLAPVNPVIVRPKQAAAMLGVGPTTLAQMVKDGRIAPPFPINGEGGRAVAWLYETIVETAQKWAQEAQEGQEATPAE